MNSEISKQYFDRAMKVLVEGCSSASRGPMNYAPYPAYIREGKGARLWDVDGNEYIDWQLSFGCLPLGHAHPKIVEIVQEKVAGGTHFATALEVEVETAELMVDMLPHVDKVRFANTGTEACMTGVRMARGITGKRKVLKFEGHYHGWYDGLLVSSNPQPVTTLGHPNDPVRIPDSSGLTPGSWEDTLVCVWNDADALERMLKTHGHEIACVVMEGAMSNMGVIPPKPGYLQQVQEMCRAYSGRHRPHNRSRRHRAGAAVLTPRMKKADRFGTGPQVGRHREKSKEKPSAAPLKTPEQRVILWVFLFARGNTGGNVRAGFECRALRPVLFRQDQLFVGDARPAPPHALAEHVAHDVIR